jgi:hypothetical protein
MTNNFVLEPNPLGIIQSRGIGDLIIALPIAHHYHVKEGRSIYWPINEAWVEQMDSVAPWVNWIPLEVDTGAYFYDTPVALLTELGITDHLCLYQALTSHPGFTSEPWFQHTSFDQYKYIRAGVPFLHKWRLAECITRNPEREQALYDQVIGTDTRPYVFTHLTSSGHTVTFDPSIIPEGWRVVPMTDQGYVFDWLGIAERAEAVIMTDSCMANLVDQLQLPVEKYFVPLHHIGLTPVQGCDWRWLPNPRPNPGVHIFRGS